MKVLKYMHLKKINLSKNNFNFTCLNTKTKICKSNFK